MYQTSSSHNTKNFDLLFKIEGQPQRQWQLRQHSKSLIRAKQGNVFVFIRKTIYLPYTKLFLIHMDITMDIMFWEFLLLYQITFSPQLKQSVITSNEHRTNKLPHELPNNLRLRKNLRKLGKIRKISNFHRIITESPLLLLNKNFVNTSKQLLKNRN